MGLLNFLRILFDINYIQVFTNKSSQRNETSFYLVAPGKSAVQSDVVTIQPGARSKLEISLINGLTIT